MCEFPFAEMMICRLVIITYLPWDLSSEWQSHLKDNQKAFAWHEPVLCSKALVFFTVCYCLFITIYELMICVWVATASRLLVLCSFISSILNFDKKKKYIPLDFVFSISAYSRLRAMEHGCAQLWKSMQLHFLNFVIPNAISHKLHPLIGFPYSSLWINTKNNACSTSLPNWDSSNFFLALAANR